MNEQILILSNQLGEYARIMVDKQIYSNIAILKVCYEMSNGNHMHISNGDKLYSIDIYTKSADLPSVCHVFMDKLIDQELRQKIIEETANIRELIISKAFYEVAKNNKIDWGSIDTNILVNDYNKDALGILTVRG